MMKKKILGILLSLSILSLAAGCSASKTEPEKAVSAGEEQAGTDVGEPENKGEPRKSLSLSLRRQMKKRKLRQSRKMRSRKIHSRKIHSREMLQRFLWRTDSLMKIPLPLYTMSLKRIMPWITQKFPGRWNSRFPSLL